MAAADDAIANSWIQPAVDLLNQSESLEEFQAALPKLYGQLDDSAVVDITAVALELAQAEGMEEIG